MLKQSDGTPVIADGYSGRDSDLFTVCVCGCVGAGVGANVCGCQCATSPKDSLHFCLAQTNELAIYPVSVTRALSSSAAEVRPNVL